ncbi:MAG: chemotaxis response regulator protein-glutamate methylesterase [Pseudomonadales bacterium]|nr:chemotaxis response regulator protein-glutamate methylesterase [Pseudomonadales bacterium]
MAVRVLVVDDSGFFRRRVCEILKSVTEIEVVGTASNGREAVEQSKRLKPDVITMDYEMPVMDGISAVKEIMASQPTPVLMFSSLTYEGARVTLDALAAGAVDFLPKNFEDISRDSSTLQDVLKQRIIAVAKSHLRSFSPSVSRGVPSEPPKPEPSKHTISPPRESRRNVSNRPDANVQRTQHRSTLSGRSGQSVSVRASDVSATPRQVQSTSPTEAVRIKPRSYSCVLIGTSTGGPLALQKVLTQLPRDFPAPIVLVQHMPASFTPAFAERLNKLCAIEVREASDGDTLQKGVALLAPGGKQMMLESRGGTKVRILEGDNRLNYKPCVDVTFGSAAKVFPGKTLGIILTGMGADGREGCRMMKNAGSAVWSQNEDSSVIYGMPMAVAKAGLTDLVLSLEEFAPQLISSVV